MAHIESSHSNSGLRLLGKADEELLAQERTRLSAAAGRGALSRWREYMSMSGPGWMQSAMTLGAGSAMASLFAGAFLQYKLLWVQPVAMLLGIVMMSAISYQTLSTGQRPFQAMKKYAHPALAWAWALGALGSTIVWHLPQYALAGGMAENMLHSVTKREFTSSERTGILLLFGVIFLVISTKVVWSYGRGIRGIRIYERFLKILVWTVVIAFAVVVIRSSMLGKIDWTEVGRGYYAFTIPTDSRAVSVLMAAFGAAIGMNMTFLFPYTLLSRGWGREHRPLSRFDLFTGMFLPYCAATSLMVIATGCTIYQPELFASGSTILPPTKAAAMLEAAGLGTFFSQVVFGLGMLGMALSTIVTQMLVCGFAACEIFGVEPTGWRYRLGCLLPAPAMIGVILWQRMGPWIVVPTTAISSLLLPVAYLGFFILNNRRKYLGADKPSGVKAWLWNIAMLLAIGVTTSSVAYYLYSIAVKN